MDSATPVQLIRLLQIEYGDHRIGAQNLVLLKRGRYCNADVYRFTANDGQVAVVKTFHAKPWGLRNTFGQLFICREVKAVSALKHFPGIPSEMRLLGPYALVVSYIPGEPLGSLKTHRNRKLPKTFFLEMERMVDRMHKEGYVHLELRNLGNIICGLDGQPHLIDFQSSINTKRLPARLRQLMEDVDRSGIYKCWSKVCEEKLDPRRADFLERSNHLRKLWVFKGYGLRKFRRRMLKPLSKFPSSRPDISVPS